MNKENYKIRLKNIRTFIFDVDGVLTDGKLLITSNWRDIKVNGCQRWICNEICN